MRIFFQRITSSGEFIPEIDGLRFLAIFGVVLHHLHDFFRERLQIQLHSFPAELADRLISNGHLGVPLFFVISAYLLGLPFVSAQLKGSKAVSLKNYFLRRLTRLEPPYFIAMTLLMVMLVFLTHKIPVSKGLPSYFSSLFYLHWLFFPGEFPKINGVAWSLEIEVQFYILAPLITSLIYRIKQVFQRRLLFIVLMLMLVVVHYLGSFPVRTLADYLHWFLAGILLADFKALDSGKMNTIISGNFLASILLIVFFFSDPEDAGSKWLAIAAELFQLAAVFILFYMILHQQAFRFLSKKFFAYVGGMCYSIYLLHYPVISFFGKFLLRFGRGGDPFLVALFSSLIILFLILAISAAFYLLIERPCMDKNWYRKLFGLSLERPDPN